MIDPLEAGIQFLLGRSELSNLNGRIANKHKYDGQWSTSDASLIVILDDSTPSWYVQKQDIRLEVWCLGDTDAAAMDVWLDLMAISRDAGRVVVTTSQGNALVYSFLPESGPSYLPDKDLDMMKRILSFWRLQVSEEAVV